MSLIEQNIPSFFEGVSKQPHPTRYVGQVEDAENCDFDITVGGFGKRRGMKIVKDTGLSTGTERRLHTINRDFNDKFLLVLYNGGMKIYDTDGVEQTVNLDAAALTFLSDDPSNFSLSSIIDYTFITNTTTVVTESSANTLDDDTMPWTLVRDDGTGEFTLQAATWDSGLGSSPEPEFVGQTIQDVVYHRNRLGLVSGETVYFSEAGNLFDFFPPSTTYADSDPFGLSSSASSISQFKFGVPFRKSLFIMADTAQFEVSGTILTANNAVIDLATEYSASTDCRPLVLGDEVFFPADWNELTAVLAYVYDDETISQTADNVSKHVEGFVPASIMQLAGDATAGKMFARTSGDTDALYLYQYHYRDNQKVQSAWSRYRFDGCNILSIGKVGRKVYVLYEMDSSVWLGEIGLDSEEITNYTWAPRLDHYQILSGTYDSGTDTTTWTLGYTAVDPVAVLSNEFPTEDKMRPITLTVDGNDVTATGDYSAYDVLIGENFNAYVELSKQYVRDKNGLSLINGRLQLRYMTLRYTQSGYFKVEVTPRDRDTRTYEFAPSVVTGEFDTINQFDLESGKFRFGVKSDGETAQIKVSSDKAVPFYITSAAWIGYFNEIARQG